MDTGAYWDGDHGMNTFELDCLLPTGVIIILSVERDATIAEIKAVSIWPSDRLTKGTCMINFSKQLGLNSALDADHIGINSPLSGLHEDAAKINK